MAQKKELDKELSLIAFISLLSVLICSLLLTAIWVQIGSMNVKQAIGASSDNKNQKLPTVWVQLVGDGGLQLQLRDAPRKAKALLRKKIKGKSGEVDVASLGSHIKALKRTVPSLRTVLIQPKADAVYEHIILIMDHFKQEGLVDLGVAPL